ncbi:MAG: hypothetical protein ABR577_18180 [Pyrinomonadaceae bacterium]
MIEQTHTDNESRWRLLPIFIGGLCAPIAGRILHNWLPLPFAVAIAAFVVWLIVGWVIDRRFSGPKLSMVRVVGIAALAAVYGGVMAALLPW